MLNSNHHEKCKCQPTNGEQTHMTKQNRIATSQQAWHDLPSHTRRCHSPHLIPPYRDWTKTTSRMREGRRMRNRMYMCLLGKDRKKEGTVWRHSICGQTQMHRSIELNKLVFKTKQWPLPTKAINSIHTTRGGERIAHRRRCR